jgi:5-methyltetrahydropteroyltriglutamate--homocysteine methyltransferase
MIVAPDCGMQYLPRTVAYAKMKAMVDGAAIVRAELMRQQSNVAETLLAR